MSNIASLGQASTKRIVDDFMERNEDVYVTLLDEHPELGRVPVALLRDAYALLTTTKGDTDFSHVGGPFRLDYFIRTIKEDGFLRLELSDAGYRLKLLPTAGVSRSYDETPEMREMRKTIPPFLVLEIKLRDTFPPFSERISKEVFFETACEIYGPDQPTPILFGIAYLVDSHLTGSRLNLGLRRTSYQYDRENRRIETTFVDRRMDYALMIDIQAIQQQEDAFAARHT